jgi:succinyl-CoA synthetase beta subunit
VIDVLLKIGGENGLLTNSADEIAEIDINPLLVTSDAATAVDARFILQKTAKR